MRSPASPVWGRAPAALRNSCSHHQVRSLQAPLPGPGPRGKLPTPGEPALPFGQRWPRGDAQGQQPTAGKSRQHRAEGPGSQRGLEQIQSKAGGCLKWLSRQCRDTDGLGSFAEAPSCSPILSPLPRCLCQAPAERKQSIEPCTRPRIRQGFTAVEGPQPARGSCHRPGKAARGSSDCTTSSPLPAPVNSATDPGSPADGGLLHRGQALPKK